jgi:5'-nucleotidase
MRVLVTNDDGVAAPGIRWLARAAAGAGWEVVVAAPASEQSGTSAAITAAEDGGKVVVESYDLGGIEAYGVAASPAFIALLAVHGAFGEPPDVVLSGVNRGANAGRAVLHSGTVGAALTAAAAGIRGMAVSLDVAFPAVDDDTDRHWATAARLAVDLMPALRSAASGVVLNVNAPDVPFAALRGVRRATLARFGQVQMTVAEAGEGYLRTSIEASTEEPEPGTDVAVLVAGYASVTPIRALAELSDVDIPGID